MSKELKKYLTAGVGGWWVLTGFSGALVVIYLISLAMGNDVDPAGLVVFLIMLAVSLIPQLVTMGKMKKLAEDPNLPAMEQDFRMAQPLRKGKVRFGRYWIFVKSRRAPVMYAEIRQVYQFIQRTNFIESARTLRYVDTKGRTKDLCKLDLRGKSDEEVRQMVQLILTKNPNVKVGYK